MAVLDTSLEKESKDRYLTYALSVVSGRALPDVRDGLKPVQRRILYAMLNNLNLRPEQSHRKSAKVVGEVLGHYHPHGDIACYEAMVRMAQDFSLRYPLVDGQGNFGSLDGDNAAAYRYTEVRLREIAIDVIGEIYEETVDFRDNFDATTQEPVVFPSRVPNLLINGASGIAVGMATSIPPHNLRDTIKALIEILQDPEISDVRLTTIIKGPDFPTGCLILNSKKELDDIYRTGRGGVRMRGEWVLEELPRGEQAVVVSSIPYAVNKAQLVERIANLIIERKVPQLVDVRDESTDDVRIVLELAQGADPELAMAYLFRNTPLESNFAVNLTVLVPGEGGSLRPELLSLKQCLKEFLVFRKEVTQRKLAFERKKLLERIHILEGLVIIFDALDEAIQIVRKSDGRSDAAERLRKAFELTEVQSLAIVDMRVYQLSKTNIADIRQELKDKTKRVAEIDKILASKKEIAELVRQDLEVIAEKYGDRRKSPLVKDVVDVEFNAEDYVVQEDVYAIVTADGWIKRVRQTNELSSTRLREGDTILTAHAVSTVDTIIFLTNQGSLFALRVADFPSSSGFGNPVQKSFKFRDEERVVATFALKAGDQKPEGGDYIADGDTIALVSKDGVGFGLTLTGLQGIKRNGKRAIKLREDDELRGASLLTADLALFTRKGYGLLIKKGEVPIRDTAAIGVQLLKVAEGDALAGIICKGPQKISLALSSGRTKELSFSELASGHRGLRGNKVISQGEIIAVGTVQKNKT